MFQGVGILKWLNLEFGVFSFILFFGFHVNQQGLQMEDLQYVHLHLLSHQSKGFSRD